MRIFNVFEVTDPNVLFSKKENVIAFFLFVILWIYLFLRGIHLPVMHDEIATFYFYVHTGIVFPPEAHYDANNHVLNSLLSHWSYQLFGSSPLALRLPNILAFCAFFFGVKGIAARIEHIIFRWGFLLSVSMSYFIFEYFSETRGYGLSLAFLVLAIYQYIKLTEDEKTKHVIFAGIFLWLATCANLTVLVSSVILFGLMFIHSFLIDYKTNKKRLIYKITALILTGLPFLILVKWSFKLKELGLLYYGSLDGFYPVTVKSLFEVFVGSYHIWMAVLVTVLFGIILIFLVKDLIQTRSLLKLIHGKNSLPLLLVGSVLIINLLALILEVNFPEDRAGIYLFIYLSGAVAFTFGKIAKQYKWVIPVAVLFLYFPVSFIVKTDLRQASFWIDARNSQPIYDRVTAMESNFKFPLVVGGYATQELCWYYMNYRDGGHQGRLHWTNHPGLDTDVLLICPQRLPEIPEINTYYDSLYYDRAADLALYKRKKFLKKTLKICQDVDPIQDYNQDYYTLMQVPADSFINKTIFVGVEMTLDAEAEPFIARFGATADQSEDPKTLAYEFIQVDWLRKSWKGEPNNFLQGTLIHNVPEGSETISFYLWNQYFEPFSISNGKCYIYELERDF
ncbi:MAG: hypothetical protein HUJ25_11515 [Crocinitomicaceae bacterium]|nr:hypothetical protein [Crocinitomicaceae bacterium]